MHRCIVAALSMIIIIVLKMRNKVIIFPKLAVCSPSQLCAIAQSIYVLRDHSLEHVIGVFKITRQFE